jgi:hypothetical protein
LTRDFLEKITADKYKIFISDKEKNTKNPPETFEKNKHPLSLIILAIDFWAYLKH